MVAPLLSNPSTQPPHMQVVIGDRVDDIGGQRVKRLLSVQAFLRFKVLGRPRCRVVPYRPHRQHSFSFRQKNLRTRRSGCIKQTWLLSSSYRFLLCRRPIHPRPARPWVQPRQVNSVTPRNARYGRYTAGLPHICATGLLGQAPSTELPKFFWMTT